MFKVTEVYSLVAGDQRTAFALETARQAQDRVGLLECDHSRLSRQTDVRFAAAQEFEDFMLNRADEDWVEVTGMTFHATHFTVRASF